MSLRVLISLCLMFPLQGCFKFGKKKHIQFDGYETLSSNRVESIGSQVVQLKHKKSGASIVLLKNADPAKTFTAAFRTPPYDDSGLFHIFEHAVLAGSRKYPAKESFNRLASGSVASYINAFTSSVYTGYPFVTKSEKEFDNLLSLYLDAVFFPKVITEPRIVKREGWRYEVTPDGKKMSINGIVLSEMQGVFSSPGSSLLYHVQKALLPQTPYSYSHGGFPDRIARLTFEQIKDAHKTYYHPQNSILYFYGDLDYKSVLAEVDKEFLGHFEKSSDFKKPKISQQSNFNYTTPVYTATYPGKKLPNKDYVLKGVVLGSQLSPVEEEIAHVLADAFSGNPSSPLRLRMQKEKLAQIVGYLPVGQDNAFMWYFEGANAENREKIETILDEEMRKVVANGIDTELLDSIVNSYEFSEKNKNSNGSEKGQKFASTVFNNWLFEKQALAEALDIEKVFKVLRQKLSDKEYVKNFYRKYFFDNKKTRWVVIKPDPNFSNKLNAGLGKQVEEALKNKSLGEYFKEDKDFREWVQAKDSEEDLKKVPVITAKDLKNDEKPINYSKKKISETEVLEFVQKTSGITYTHFYFDLRGVAEENLKKIPMLNMLLQETDVEGIGFKELSKQISSYLGGLNLSVDTFKPVDKDDYKPMLVVSLKYLNENQKKAFELLNLVLTKSKFTPSDKVDNVLKEFRTAFSRGIARRARNLPSAAAQKESLGERGNFNEEINGGVFENFVMTSELTAKALVPDLEKLLVEVFNKNRLKLINLTTTEDNMVALNREVKLFRDSLPMAPKADVKWSFSGQENYDGFAIPGGVQYVYEVASLKEAELKFHGSMNVYAKYLQDHYVNPKIRQQAGAYGAWSWFQRSGQFVLATYRDPSLAKSYEVFSGVLDFMKKEKFTKEKLWPFILGSLKLYYRDDSTEKKTKRASDWYLSEFTWEDYRQLRKEILETAPEDMAKITAGLEKAMKTSKKSVAGNADKIKKEAKFLKNVLTIQ